MQPLNTQNVEKERRNVSLHAGVNITNILISMIRSHKLRDVFKQLVFPSIFQPLHAN